MGNVVIGLPTNPTDKGEDNDIVKTEQTFYSVSCVHAGWGPAHHCGAHCTRRGHLDANKTTCPEGSHAYENVIWDCYCMVECTPFNDLAGDEAETNAQA